jgi:hypothetical protein
MTSREVHGETLADPRAVARSTEKNRNHGLVCAVVFPFDTALVAWMARWRNDESSPDTETRANPDSWGTVSP